MCVLLSLLNYLVLIFGYIENEKLTKLNLLLLTNISYRADIVDQIIFRAVGQSTRCMREDESTVGLSVGKKTNKKRNATHPHSHTDVGNNVRKVILALFQPKSTFISHNGEKALFIEVLKSSG